MILQYQNEKSADYNELLKTDNNLPAGGWFSSVQLVQLGSARFSSVQLVQLGSARFSSVQLVRLAGRFAAPVAAGTARPPRLPSVQASENAIFAHIYDSYTPPGYILHDHEGFYDL